MWPSGNSNQDRQSPAPTQCSLGEETHVTSPSSLLFGWKFQKTQMNRKKSSPTSSPSQHLLPCLCGTQPDESQASFWVWVSEKIMNEEASPRELLNLWFWKL